MRQRLRKWLPSSIFTLAPRWDHGRRGRKEERKWRCARRGRAKVMSGGGGLDDQPEECSGCRKRSQRLRDSRARFPQRPLQLLGRRCAAAGSAPTTTTSSGQHAVISRNGVRKWNGERTNALSPYSPSFCSLPRRI